MSVAPATARSLPSSLLRRAIVFVGVLIAESLIVGSLPHPWFHLHQIMATPIVFGAAFLFFGRRKLQRASLDIAPVRRAWLLLHLLALAVLLASTAILLRLIPATTAIWTALWYAALTCLPIALTLALFPLRQLAGKLTSLRSVWLYAGLTTLATMSARSVLRWVWDAPDSAFGHALQQSTFFGTRVLLRLFYPNVIAVPATHLLGTPAFIVEVAGTCSGIEGLALMLIFTIGWLIYARRELRLGRAVLLVPAALALSWLFNLVRIAALIAIGDAGHPDVAINGFHSEAGWIMFNAIAVGFLIAAQHIRWLRRSPLDPAPATIATRNPAAPYLLPFLAVLATSLLTRAASSGFEWLYPLRLLAALAALFAFRSEYRKLDWRFTWLGPAAGVLTAAIWLAFATRPHTATTLPALAPTWQRIGWLTARILAAGLTVPIVEELAFRGFLARRIVSADFDALPYIRLTPLAIILSAAAFGLLHGRLWLPGILAGLLFALVARLRNRLGEAVAAHATANLLLAIYALTTGDLSIW